MMDFWSKIWILIIPDSWEGDKIDPKSHEESGIEYLSKTEEDY